MNLKKNKILILGASGFLGRNFCKKLVDKKINFHSLNRKDCDLTDYKKLYKILNQIKPDIVFNFAGKVGGIHYNITKPAEIISNNIRISINVFEALSSIGAKKLVNIGSSCSYPDLNNSILSEKMLFKGNLHQSIEAYGFWKLFNIVAAKAYKKEKQLDSINIIFPALYGPLHDFEGKNSHVMASLISRFVECKKKNLRSITCWGNGRPIREFLYIDDAIEAILLTASKYNKIEPLNIGEGKGYTIKYIAELIKELTSFDGKIIWDKSKPNGVMKKILNTGKMKKVLKWQPNTNIKQGIKHTLEWYLKSKKFVK
jgi:GDP-L-fucose synthase|tara:strand:- start:3969 stop:4910 length:942 start_codon:yes stop_codon:yes gene_type:complete